MRELDFPKNSSAILLGDLSKSLTFLGLVSLYVKWVT